MALASHQFGSQERGLMSCQGTTQNLRLPQHRLTFQNYTGCFTGPRRRLNTVVVINYGLFPLYSRFCTIFQFRVSPWSSPLLPCHQIGDLWEALAYWGLLTGDDSKDGYTGARGLQTCIIYCKNEDMFLTRVKKIDGVYLRWEMHGVWLKSILHTQVVGSE